MSRRDAVTRLRDMLDYAREAAAMSKGKRREDLDADRMLNLALVRLVEVVGEAAANVPVQVRSRYPEVEWPDIIGLRNRLIHRYSRVDFDVLWGIVTNDLPPLIRSLERIIPIEEQAP
jgi:uncharacterized protein with HEPN domain